MTDDLQEYADLAAARAALRESISTDPATLAAGLDPGFVVRSHLRVVGRAFAGLAAGKYSKLLISLPPQVGKSTIATQWGPVWWLLKHPTAKILMVSYGASLAESHAFAAQTHIKNHGAEFNLHLHPKFSTRSDWRITSGGGMFATGITGGVTGRSADLILIDDPHKNRAEADSLRAREAIHSAYVADLISRMAPDAPQVIVTTRWHVDDLAARVLSEEGKIEEGGAWKYLRMPAICDDPARDPLRRALGEPLPHPKVDDGDTERLMRHWESRRRSRPHEWAALYQADPAPLTGTLVSWELLRSIRDPEPDASPVKIAVAVDPSGGGRDEAGVIGGWYGDDKRMYITHDRSGNMSSAQWSRAACQLAFDTSATVICVERNFGADMAVLVIRTAWEALQREGVIPDDQICPRIDDRSVKTGKMVRAAPIAGQMEEDRVRLVGLHSDLETQWATYQEDSGESPGRLDASVILGYLLLRPPGSSGHISDPGAASRAQIAAQATLGPRIRRH